MDDLWDEIMRKCLERAKDLLDKETAQTEATVKAVQGLVETAIVIRGHYELPIGPKAVCVFKDGKVKIEKG